jgi:phenylacetic acid degradation operon negative regulatory protein
VANNNKFNSRAEALIDDFITSKQGSANSLILTIFGDSISAHGGTIWLGSLIKLVARLGISQRLVRTSVFRLIENGILQSQQVGRRSFYSLTDKGFRQFSSAAERIYRYHQAIWDGEWRLVFTTFKNITPEDKERFQKELLWLGFNRLSAGVYAHPTANIDEVKDIVKEMKLGNYVATMQARSTDDQPAQASSNLVKYCFNFDTIKVEYQSFIEYFEDFLNEADSASNEDKDPELCFLLRTILIHKFRHLLLHEPELPRELVPDDCLSHPTRDITERLYKLITENAESHFAGIAEGLNGGLSELSDEYFTRFGGLG